MKGTLRFDPAEYEYGPATPAVRQLLLTWAAVDWFVPPRDTAAAAQAGQLFAQHQARAQKVLPERFPAPVEIQLIPGAWPEFAALCQRVQTQSWDWKYSTLKRLALAHAEARGWSLNDQARHAGPLDAIVPPRPGDLFFRFGEHVMWNSTDPELDLRAAVPAQYVEVAGWYRSYANMDAIDSLQWQLAEGDNRLDSNPFVPLIGCYAAGFYPFSLGPTAVVLFSFTA